MLEYLYLFVDSYNFVEIKYIITLNLKQQPSLKSMVDLSVLFRNY